MDIFAAGFRQVVQVQCDSGAPLDANEETVNAASSSLSYDSTTGRYNFVWITNSAWARSCRQLQVKLNDGEMYTALFSFKSD